MQTKTRETTKRGLRKRWENLLFVKCLICKTFLNRPSVFFACQILSEMLKDVLQKRGGDDDQKKIVRIICSWNSFLIEIKISRGLYNQLVSRRVSGDFRVIWHNLQPLMGTFTFLSALEGKGKVKLKLVQLPNSQQVPKKDHVSSFRFFFTTKQQFFIFQKTLAKDWDVKMGFWGWGKK